MSSAKFFGRAFEGLQTGRTLTAGFSYLQRIEKSAATQVWLADALNPFMRDDVQWAAIRQFELLREEDNLMIDELDVMELEKSHERLLWQRSTGYLMTFILLGRYDPDAERDDLAILDKKIQDEITQLINIIYLGDLSDQKTKMAEAFLNAPEWAFEKALPHVALAMEERKLFQPEKRTREERLFFEILKRLSSKHIIHEAAVGLAVPEKDKVKDWIYIADSENRSAELYKAMMTVTQHVGAAMTHLRACDHKRASTRHYNAESLAYLRGQLATCAA